MLFTSCYSKLSNLVPLIYSSNIPLSYEFPLCSSALSSRTYNSFKIQALTKMNEWLANGEKNGM